MRGVLTMLVVMAAALSACDRRAETAAPAPPNTTPAPALSSGPASFLTVSDSNPAVGSTIIVAGNVAAASAARGVASFRARLVYNTAALEYVEEVPLPGMMRALNPQPGRIIVAGASPTALADSRLFAVRFRVRAPQPLGALTLALDELNDADYASQLKQVTPLAQVRLDRTLTRVQTSAPR